MIEPASPRLLVRSKCGIRVAMTPQNKNTNWLDNRTAWTFYVLMLVLSWLVVSGWTDPGMAWTYVHILHGLITYYLFHWTKGSPITDDQGKYDSLTFWEQIDDGVQHTATRKFLTVVPVILFFLATHGTDYARQPLGVNLVVVLVLLIAKLSSMHKVRILGINRY